MAPLDPVGGAFHLSGRVSVPHFVEAVDLVCGGVDILRTRLRRTGDQYIAVPDTDPAGIPVTTTDLRDSAPARLAHRLAETVQSTKDRLCDMQNGPPAALSLVHLDGGDLLSAAFDHGLLDQYGWVSLVRLLGEVYGHLERGDSKAAERAATSSPSFLAHAYATQHDVAGRSAARDFWGPVVRGAEQRLPETWGNRRPIHEMSATSRRRWTMPAGDIPLLLRACQVTGAPRSQVFIAGLTLAVSGATGVPFTPVTYHRHGRLPGVRPPLGPLWETLITFPPADAPSRLSAWVRKFINSNAETPGMAGLALVDFAPLDTVMTLRYLTVNVMMPRRPAPFGPLRAMPIYPVDLPKAYTRGGLMLKHNIGIRLYSTAADSFVASIHHDPSDLPDPDRLFEAATHAIRLMADETVSTGPALDEAGAVLRGGLPAKVA
jgi:hypothetical protein